VLGLVAAALCLSPSPGSGDPRPLPDDPRTPIAVLPYEITAPGSYYLTRNLRGRPGAGGITIAANDVTLDLNGFALRGTSGSVAGIVAVARGGRVERLHNVRVHNGAIANWGGPGVDLAIADDVQVSDLRVSGNGAGLRVGNGGQVHGTSVKDNRGLGIEGGDCTTVLGASVDGNGADGINVGKGSVVTASSTCHNTRGIVAGRGSTLTGVTASENRGDGIVAESSVVKEATAHGNLSNGIVANAASNVIGCAANQNGAAGIFSSDFGRIADCTAFDNDGPGISIGIGNTVIGNQLSFNAQGINVSSSRNRIESNHATDNTQCGYCFHPSAGMSMLAKNSARGNGNSAAEDYAFQTQFHGGILGNFFESDFSPAPPWSNFSFEQ
jgi:parallel beta-helix repeat protein